jgi:hypothetical protein
VFKGETSFYVRKPSAGSATSKEIILPAVDVEIFVNIVEGLEDA